MALPRILVFSGSVRSGSLNGKLAALAARRLREAGGEVREVSLKNYPLPIYDGDDEARDGVPANARALHGLFASHAGIFIASPEYNAGVAPIVKNTIDWVSRVKDGGGAAAAFARPVFGIGAASPGGFGGYRGLTALRHSLVLGLSALVLPEMVSVGAAQDAFDEAGELKNERSAGLLATLAKRLVEEASRRGA
ncbi:NAD(P)H-dependent oxidoreductase [Chelatococcus sp. SYSU_G07232]|uniref:NAD(P)H-dependent oxidoreductase n=1 Tax=Chelatococcus albus TaxID=3047466 RepID=A0ABT7AHQ2_9HYPH|nr:NAD(P)H-dependent oxidoreductase [Chelatococcus sp. SYSU_G07232]MDJ1158912.1 NAD(P)H-dependent oxidoreductase [Chelatococcus sp. SYSU_G07232]